MPHIVENFVPFYSDPDKKKKKEEVVEPNPKVEELKPSVDYDAMQKVWIERLDDVELGKFEGEYEFSDGEAGISMLGNSRFGFVSFRKDSPMLAKLEGKLVSLGYGRDKEGEKNIVFGKRKE